MNIKPKSSFICFDVCEFYPSISEDLLNKALKFTSTYDNISNEEINIITHAKRSLLFQQSTPWCKRSNSKFDVTMGSFDSAKTCELIVLYMLSQLSHLNINIGLYRDDGLAISHTTPRQTELIKKEICAIFARTNLKITIEANKKMLTSLTSPLDLTTGTYKLFMKPNNTPLYVHKDSNHPPSITKHP